MHPGDRAETGTLAGPGLSWNGAPGLSLNGAHGHGLECVGGTIQTSGALRALTAVACSLTVSDSFILLISSERHNFLNVV